MHSIKRKKFLVRLFAWIFFLIIYCMIVYVTTLGYENLTEHQQNNIVKLLIFMPTIFIIILFGEITKVFDEKVGIKETSRNKKVYFGLLVLWAIIFVSLLIYSFI